MVIINAKQDIKKIIYVFKKRAISLNSVALSC